jgi:N-acylneuraminate cytidylyltransferase
MKKKPHNIIAIIPARGGSKGLPRKNIRLLSNKPLIAYSIESASQSQLIHRVIVSTDDEEIAEIVKKFGAEVIIRPSELATDTAATIDVILHCLSSLEEQNDIPDCIVLLQPTSPLRTVKDIDGAISEWVTQDCDSVISVCETDHTPYLSCTLGKKFLIPTFGEQYFKLRRQDIPQTFVPNGAIYIATPGYLKQKRTFYSDRTLPFVMPKERSVDIDTEIDIIVTEAIMKKGNLST